LNDALLVNGRVIPHMQRGTDRHVVPYLMLAEPYQVVEWLAAVDDVRIGYTVVTRQVIGWNPQPSGYLG